MNNSHCVEDFLRIKYVLQLVAVFGRNSFFAE